VRVRRRPEELLDAVPEWAELAGAALEPNAFYEP
jgi:hypothetical protein